MMLALLTMLSPSMADRTVDELLPCATWTAAGQVSTIGCTTGPPQAWMAEAMLRGPVTGAAAKSSRLLSVSWQPSAARWIELTVDGAGAGAPSARLAVPKPTRSIRFVPSPAGICVALPDSATLPPPAAMSKLVLVTSPVPTGMALDWVPVRPTIRKY